MGHLACVLILPLSLAQKRLSCQLVFYCLPPVESHFAWPFLTEKHRTFNRQDEGLCKERTYYKVG